MMSRNSFMLLLTMIVIAVVPVVQAVPFATGPSNSVIVGNDSSIGPDSRYYSREIRAKNDSSCSQRQVSFILYDLTGLKPSGGVYANCSLRSAVKCSYATSIGKNLTIYAVKEAFDDALPTNWNTSPGLVNNPAPLLNSEITPAALDMAELYPVASCTITFTGWLWYQTAGSVALTDILNQDTDNKLMLMFVTCDPEGNFQIRSRGDNTVDTVTGLSNGPCLMGEISDPAWTSNPGPANGSNTNVNLSQESWTGAGIRNSRSAVPAACNVYPAAAYPDYKRSGLGITIVQIINQMSKLLFMECSSSRMTAKSTMYFERTVR